MIDKPLVAVIEYKEGINQRRIFYMAETSKELITAVNTKLEDLHRIDINNINVKFGKLSKEVEFFKSYSMKEIINEPSVPEI